MLILKKVVGTPYKQHLCDLPIMDKLSIWDYAIAPDNEAALVYTLFIDGYDGVHYQVKAALYSALTFLDKTDMRDRGIPIYFAIQDTDYNKILPYFENTGIKKEFVIPFKSNARGYLKIMDAFFLPELQKYSRLFMVDPDVYVRPLSTNISFTDKILWDTEKYEVAAVFFYHNRRGIIPQQRYDFLKEIGALSKFPQISETPQEELIKTFNEPPKKGTRRNHVIAWFVGFSDRFLAQIEEPYKTIVQFTTDVYRRGDEDKLTDEDVMDIFFQEFHTQIFDLSQAIPFDNHFVRHNESRRNDTILNHVWSANLEEFPYSQWKSEWLAEVEETINRHII